MDVVPLYQLEGATIDSFGAGEEMGFHIYMKDGRVLIIVGEVSIGILNPDDRVLQ